MTARRLIVCNSSRSLVSLIYWNRSSSISWSQHCHSSVIVWPGGISVLCLNMSQCLRNVCQVSLIVPLETVGRLILVDFCFVGVVLPGWFSPSLCVKAWIFSWATLIIASTSSVENPHSGSWHRTTGLIYYC